MSSIVDLYNEKFGTKTAAIKDMPPAVKAKFDANKKNPPGKAGGPGHGSEKTSADKLAEFQGGKIANVAFFDELGKCVAQDKLDLQQKEASADPLVQAIRTLSL